MIDNQETLLQALKNILHLRKNNEYLHNKLQKEGIQCSLEDVEWAREELKKQGYVANRMTKDSINAEQEAESGNYIAELEEQVVKLTEESVDHTTGQTTKTFQSTKPLSPQEIEKLAQVDSINTYIARTWLKSHKNGIWTYSIDIRFRVKDFYSKEELKEKIKELLPDYTITRTASPSKEIIERALFIYLSDDHAGAIYENSIHGNEYSGSIYAKRLLDISDQVKTFDVSFDKVYVISLGDQQNGYNSLTTRGGHEVKSESNKKQFDIYVTARRLFYDDLFSSGIGKEYQVINLENSNHSGLGMSYMANQALNFWLEAKYPFVKTYSTDLAIDLIEYGIHAIALTHGKDEKQQKTPFPLNLNDRTDVFFYQYFDKKGLSPQNRELHVAKGDLHQLNVNYGKSCRYVNVPSIMGSSNYSEINFGDTRAGALLEIYSKDTYHVSSTPIWFK